MSVKTVHLFRTDDDTGEYDDGAGDDDDAFWAR
jgi:hypothetical protein